MVIVHFTVLISQCNKCVCILPLLLLEKNTTLSSALEFCLKNNLGKTKAHLLRLIRVVYEWDKMHIECNNYDKGNKSPQQALVILGLVKVCDINKLLVEICYFLLGPFGWCLLCRRPKVLQWNVGAKKSTKLWKRIRNKFTEQIFSEVEQIDGLKWMPWNVSFHVKWLEVIIGNGNCNNLIIWHSMITCT